MSNGYTIRDYGSETWLVWVGYPQNDSRRHTIFVAQINPNRIARQFAMTTLADDLDAGIENVSQIAGNIIQSKGQ